NNEYVIFPVKSSNDLPSDEDYQLVQQSFISREKRPNLDKRLIDILPSELYEFRPRGFDILGGKVVIIQLHESLIPFSESIGGILIEKGFASVYLRESNVEGPFRLRRLRLLQGVPVERVIHRENGVDIVINLRDTYFNPRLSTEHERITQVTSSHETVLDMFTGVGPFALQLAKHRSASVEAWDINPKAIACLQESISLNRINPNRIQTKIGDAKDLAEAINTPIFDRVLMNLPTLSANYIQAALSVCKKGGTIHYYRFGETRTAGKDVIGEFNLISTRTEFETTHIQTHRVREIAPGKTHYCCEFKRIR
ncbi:MAG: class I SAM-dependent methyltransferase family protein, partial [Candidatus Hodarchaeota archaeon]